jgi:hypothetical protein
LKKWDLEFFRTFRIPLASPVLISHNPQPFSGGFSPTPPERYPAAPEGRPGGGLTAFQKGKNVTNLEEKSEEQNRNSGCQDIAYSLPWLSHAGGLGGGSPPGIIPLFLCLFKVKTKKATLMKSYDQYLANLDPLITGIQHPFIT